MECEPCNPEGFNLGISGIVRYRGVDGQGSALREKPPVSLFQGPVFSCLRRLVYNICNLSNASIFIVNRNNHGQAILVIIEAIVFAGTK